MNKQCNHKLKHNEEQDYIFCTECGNRWISTEMVFKVSEDSEWKTTESGEYEIGEGSDEAFGLCNNPIEEDKDAKIERLENNISRQFDLIKKYEAMSMYEMAMFGLTNN